MIFFILYLIYLKWILHDQEYSMLFIEIQRQNPRGKKDLLLVHKVFFIFLRIKGKKKSLLNGFIYISTMLYKNWIKIII